MADKKLEKMRHSCSHVLAAAVLKLFPKAKLGIGPAIEDGFYYDFDFGKKKITEKDLGRISAEMEKIIKEKLPFKKEDISIKKAKQIFKNQPYKLELIKDLEKEKTKKVSIYKSGDFLDLCLGPHVTNTSKIGPFKLLSIAGAYWRGSETNPMLTRIYGTCFDTQKNLNTYLKLREEAKKRDHRKLGPQLELFLLHGTSPGMPYWLPNGTIIYNELLKFWREEHKKRDYQEISTPQVAHKKLWEISGHWDHYRDEMFIIPINKQTVYALKPMNCPNAMIVFASKPRSYRELPLRLSDSDVLHRKELSGVITGLLRVQKFAQDDAHIFIKEDQIEKEYERILEIVDLFYSVFDIEYKLRLGTRPLNFMGDIKTWNKAEDALKQILNKKAGKDKYLVSSEDGAFYGPKIDITMKDVLGRSWQMGTIQLDFFLPKRFKLKYADKDGKQKTPVCIHRVIYGSLERFIGILIEHYGGAFPVWLSPIQTIVIPITDKHNQYGQKVVDQLKKENVRVKIDDRSETTSAKIRDAELQKIPYILVVGDKEVKAKKVNVRVRGEKVIGPMTVSKFINLIKEDIVKKRQI